MRFRAGIIAVLLTACGEPVEIVSESARSRTDAAHLESQARKAGSESVRFLSASSGNADLSPAPLKLLAEIRLQPPESFQGYSKFRAFSDGSLFFVEGLQQRIFEFDSTGRFVQRIGDVPSRVIPLSFIFDFRYQPSRDGFFVADGKGIKIFDRSGNYRGPLEVTGLPGAFALESSDEETLLVCISILDGPFWAIVREGQVVKTFVARRRELLSPDEEWRAGAAPPFWLAVGSDSNLYALSHTDYEIRKYDPEGNYLGDFQPQSDDRLTPPPDRVDQEMRRRWEVTGRRDMPWSLPVGLAVANQYLVVQLGIDGVDERLMHYYTLAGQTAFEQAETREQLLGTDSAGRIYFGDLSDPWLIRVYSLGE